MGLFDAQVLDLSTAMSEHITTTPQVAEGKPHIVGRRVTVQDIAVAHRRDGESAPQIAADRDLRLADVYAALSYYYDHRSEIDRAIHDEAAFLEQLRQSVASGLLSPAPRAS